MPRKRADGLKSVPGRPSRGMAITIQASPCGTTTCDEPICLQKQGGQEAGLGIKGRAGASCRHLLLTPCSLAAAQTHTMLTAEEKAAVTALGQGESG